jgi:hypothetical protein
VCASSLTKPIWTAVFQVWHAFSPYVSLLFLSSSEVEAVFDLVLMFLLSSARNHLLLIKEKGSSSFLMNDSFSSRITESSRFLWLVPSRQARGALFLAFVVFRRELSVSSLFPFQFFISLQFHVLFMIYSFLFLTFGHNSSS